MFNIKMRKLILIFYLLVIAVSCKRENEFAFPLIQTGEVTDIDSTGVVFHAKITDLSKTGITEYGFVWGPLSMKGTDPFKIVVQVSPNNGTFSAEVSTEMFSDTSYYVKAFARNENYTTYGKIVTFQSKGSRAPVILDFFPKEGTNGSRITIKGKNFSSYLSGNSVRFGKAVPQIIDVSDESILVSLPDDLNVSGRVNITVETSGKTAISESKFVLEGCDILNFTPESLMIGDTIVVNANDIGATISDNILRIEGSTAEIIDKVGNAIVAVVPYSPKLGFNEITITVNGKTCYSQDSVFLENPWSIISGSFPFIRHYGSKGFSIANKVYTGFGMTFDGPFKDLHEFSFTSNTWRTCADLPGTGRVNPVAFSVGDKGYVGLGDDNSGEIFNDFFEFDPVNNLWTRKSDFPGMKRGAPFCISIGNKAYIGTGLGIYEDSRDWWEYDPAYDQWKRLNDYPGGTFTNLLGFVHQGKGYIIECESHMFWKYDPSSDSWERLVDFPGYLRYGAAGFSFGSYAYVGMGLRPNDFVVLTDFWRFDFEKNKWIRIADIPFKGRVGALGFAIDNKGVICSGSYYYYPDLLTENFIVFNPK